ncbi:unnamed protein product [Calypogeia fissa]
MSAADSQTGEGEDGAHCGVDEVIECHPSDHIAPDSVAFSPDDKLISYLVTPESTLGTNIVAFDLTLKEQRLLLKLPDEVVEEAEEGILSSTEERRRKRLGESGLGFTRYHWAKGASGPTLMVPLPGGIYVQDEQTAELRLRVPSTYSSPALNPQLSPDGCSIAYVRDDEIYVIPTTSGEEIQITSGARGTGKSNGVAEAMAQGETERRPGFWWSPDSRQIAFAEVDPTGVSTSPSVHQGENDADGANQANDPSGGKANVLVRLGIVSASGGEVSWVELLIGGTDYDGEEYLARVSWLLDGYLVAEVLNRAQTNLKLLKFNPSTRKRQTLLEERGIRANHADSFTPLHTGGFIWASERSGSRHLYLYDAAGDCLGPLTEGNWAVEKILGVDENAGLIYFMGTSSPQETHLYSALIFPDYKFPVENPKQLTKGKGRHSVVIDHQMQKFVDILEDRPEETPPRVHVCSLANRRLTSTQNFDNMSPHPAREEPIEPPAVSSEEEVLNVTPPASAPAPAPAPAPASATAEPPRIPFVMAESAQEELQRAAAILLKHDVAVFAGMCSRCRPILHQLLAKLALFDSPDDTVDHSAPETNSRNHFDTQDETPPTAINGTHSDTDTDSETHVRGYSQPGAVNNTEKGDDTASSGEIHGTDIHQGETVGVGSQGKAKARLWSEEQSSGSEVDDEVRNPPEDRETIEPEAPQTPAAAASEPAELRVSKTASVGSRSTADSGRSLTFHSRTDISNFAWSNATLPSPNRVGDDEEEEVSSAPTDPTSDQNGGQVESQSPAAKRTRLEQEARRMQSVVRKKDFKCIERIRGRPVNVVEGLELHEKVFNKVEMQKLIDMVYKFQEMGRNGLLRERTYSEPRKWMPGKGRVTMQFGCCYNYAQDRNGNPPGIIHDEIVDDMPDLLKTTIRRLVRWGVLPETCVPDSCIINIYDVGDCIPPHIDHHDFVRPFSTLSLLSECNILFGSKLSIVGEGKFDGPLSIPLPVGSVLVLKGNGADVAKHAVPGVPTKRISITFRKMDPLKVPRGYELPKDLRGIRTAPHLRLPPGLLVHRP